MFLAEFGLLVHSGPSRRVSRLHVPLLSARPAVISRATEHRSYLFDDRRGTM